MVKLESDWWVSIWNDLKKNNFVYNLLFLILFLFYLSSHSVHGNDRGLIGVKVDESISRRFSSELVGHHLDAHHPALAHHVDSILNTSNLSIWITSLSLN